MVDDAFGIVGTTQAGSFLVERAVAEGGFAVVYRAKHLAFSAPVALKCMRLGDGMSQRQRDVFLEKFRKEAQLLFRLSSAIPEIVRPLQVDTLEMHDGRFVPFLALEWLEGEALDQVIERRKQNKEPFQLRELLTLLAPIAKALARAHHFPADEGALAIVHRDLKPENMFLANVGGSPQIKLLDFGVATAQNAAAVAAGQAVSDDLAAFSPEYAAPEQWAPKQLGPTGPWTDVWGLTVTLVTALTGRPPYEGEPRAIRAAAIDETRRPTPKSFGLRLGEKIDRIFERALAVNPRTRIADVATLWTELEQAMGIEPSIRSLETSGQFDRPSMARPAVVAAKSHFDLDDGIDLGRASATPSLNADLAVDVRAPVSRRTPGAAPVVETRAQAIAAAPESSQLADPFFSLATVVSLALMVVGAVAGILIGFVWLTAACIGGTLVVFIIRLARR